MRVVLLWCAVVAFLGSVRAANICGENKTLGLAVMNVLNLTYAGLEAVASAAGSGDLDTACEALAAYYASSNSSYWLRIPPVKPGTGRVGNGSLVDNAVDYDIYYMAGVTTTGKIPRNADGGLNWTYKGLVGGRGAWRLMKDSDCDAHTSPPHLQTQRRRRVYECALCSATRPFA